MVTEFFGIINIADDGAITKKISDNLSYKVPHFLKTVKFKDGVGGAVSVGGKYFGNILNEGNLWLFSDISIYNSAKIFKDVSDLNDTEILLKAYRTWGKDLVGHIEGDFSFAIWDDEKKSLFCARDFPGARPFYYSLYKDGIIFGSELNFVKALFEKEPELNEDYFYDTLLALISEHDATAFKNIFRLPPGHSLFFEKGKVRVEKNFEIDPFFKTRFHDKNEYIDCLRKMLVNSVQARCKNAEKIGSELSGGLDSSTVTSIAADYAKNNNIYFSSFSNTLPEGCQELTDEKEHIKKLLDFKKIRWHEVNETKEPIPEIIKQSVKLQGCFTQQRFHMFNAGIYKAAGETGIDVLLSGFGGDEVVSSRMGTPWNDMIAERQWTEFFESIKYKAKNPLAAFLLSLKKIIAYIINLLRKRGKTFGVFSPKMLNKRFIILGLNSNYAERHNLKKRFFKRHLRQKVNHSSERLIQKINHPHVSQRLEYSYAAAAQYGVQYRYPLLDKKLIKMFIYFPPWFKNQPGMDRYLFRQVMQGLVPEDIQYRKDKSGVVIPHMNVRVKTDRDEIMEFIYKNFENSSAKEIFDLSKFEIWLDKIIERNSDNINYLMPGAFFNYLMIMNYLSDNE